MVKHKLYYAAFVAAMGSAGVLAPAVWADGEPYDLVACAAGTEAKTCTLTSDVVMTGVLELTSDLTVDLNGHNITATETGKFFKVKGHTLTVEGEGTISTTNTMNTGMIQVFGVDDATSASETNVTVGAGVTMSGQNPIVIYNNGITAYNTKVDVYGKLNGHNSGIWLIGTVKDKTNYPTVNIYKGAVVTADAAIVDAEDAGGLAVAAMGYAEWNIGEATITGVGSGVGIKGGIVNIDGATVTGTGNPVELPPELYNNGIRPSGAAVQIEKNTGYPGDIELNITAGSFVSQYNEDTIYEYGPAEGAVKSVEVTGGTYNKKPGAEYIANGYVAAEAEGGYKVVDPENMDDPAEEVDTYTDRETGEEVPYIAPKKVDWGPQGAYFIEDGGEGEGHVSTAVEFGKELIADRKATLSAVEVDKDGLTLSETKGGELIGAVEIDMLDRDGGRIEVKNNELTIYFDIDEDTHAMLAAYDKLYVVYFENGVEVERHEVYLSDPETEGYWFSFTTTHLSTYGVVGVNETQEEEKGSAATPETGTVTAAGASAMSATLLTSVTVGLLTSIVSFAYLMRRQKQ